MRQGLKLGIHTLCAAAMLIAGNSLAQADWSGGVLTADVDVTANNLFGGQPFTAVINPDAAYADKTLPTNSSGYLQGSINGPTSFSFVDLPVYAIVDDSGTPWVKTAGLFEVVDDEENLNAPLFHLQLIGELSLSLTLPVGGLYEALGDFHDLINEQTYDLDGTMQFALPPFGLPGFAWYGMDGSSVNLFDVGTSGLTIISNDDSWASGWPGATLDKNFFSVPEPGGIVLLVLGALFFVGRCRLQLASSATAIEGK